MKKFVCTVCGYVHEGDTPPEECPLCGVGPDQFEEVEEQVIVIFTAILMFATTMFDSKYRNCNLSRSLGQGTHC